MTQEISPKAAELMKLIEQCSVKDLVGHVSPPGFPDRFGNYQYTATGNLFFSCDPRPEEVHIEDIARQLSRICRFGGATKHFQSVAEHCFICSYLVPPEHALEALMHDASEAYIGDQIRPMKYLPVYGHIYLKVEGGIERAIAERFGLQYPWSKEVMKADEIAVSSELSNNVKTPITVQLNYLTKNLDWREMADRISNYYWDPEQAEDYFLNRFRVLTQQREVAVA